MCAGTLDIGNNNIATCQHCGTQQTLPVVNEERLLNLYNRADHFRQQNDFDRALAVYETILGEDNTSAEAYWRVVLCRFGIEYVEDPSTRRRIPTCHRTHHVSILTDMDYLAALEHAPDSITRSMYEEEAKTINDIQKKILAIANAEEPYDIFICYKETGTNGQRTVDSTLAQDIYYQLTNDGYNVFFARITLESRLGREYEPYIFNALNTAKVMLVVGTKKEHFEAVWVKNEWSRYLALMKDDKNRLLIPCFRDMDAYDIPDQLSHLQSQDMAKIGFIQDLVRGVKKIFDAGKTPAATVTSTAGTPVVTQIAAPGVESLVKRGHIALEDGDWKGADEFFERVLDIDPQYAPAWIGKLCVEIQISNESKLASAKSPFNDMANYKKAVRFADDGYRTMIERYNQTVKDRIAEEKRMEIETTEREMAKSLAPLRERFDPKSRIEKQAKLQEQRKADEDTLQEENTKAKADTEAKNVQAQQKYETDHKAWQANVGQIKAQYDAAYGEWQSEISAIRHLAENRRNQGLCQLCGGTFKGLFSKKCSQCSYPQETTPALPDEPQKPYILQAEPQRPQQITYTPQKLDESKYLLKNVSSDFGNLTVDIAGITWRVLDAQGGKVLLISDKVIENRAYNTETTAVTWETCTLRKYLNGGFYNKLGNMKTFVAETRNNNQNNHWYNTSGGNATTDKVFLLSLDEVCRYFGDSMDNLNKRKGATISADYFDDVNNKNRIAKNWKGETCMWWLRSPGITDKRAAGVSYIGHVSVDSLYVGYAGGGVRPALWLNLE
jgi:tetratricopeptide (TPR) repeat protein